jgi:Arc/MetJ-type ribon-helix-helix transcriptional regulator
MKTLEIELPDALAARLEELVEAGWFTSESEIGRLALEELLAWGLESDGPGRDLG